MHPHGGDGAESLRVDDVAAAVTAVRRACPGVSVGVTTGLWVIGGDVRLRQRLVTSWAAMPPAERPDFASANLSEDGFADLVEALEGAGIEIELGVWSPADAEAPAAQSTAAGWPRIRVEVLDAPAEHAILRRLDQLGVTGPRLPHGERAACWPLVAHAGRLGLRTRIGLEDTTTTGHAGRPVADNAELVRLGLAVWNAAAAP